MSSSPRHRSVLSLAAGTALLTTVVAAGWAVGADDPDTDGTDADPDELANPAGTEPGEEVEPGWPDPEEHSVGDLSGTTSEEAVQLLRQADAPDPFLLLDESSAWLFTTNTPSINVPVWTLSQGELTLEDALPVLPAWAEPGRTWAPAVVDAGDHWVLAFTATSTSTGGQCIGVATSTTPEGPYWPQPVPLVCEQERGGSIDPSFVVDDQSVIWLLFKDDGNCCGLPTAIRSVPLTADGLALAGEPRTLIGADQPWESGVVEAPTMTQVDGRWLLLYSGNRWDQENYAVGAAWCDGPAGPCIKQEGLVLEATSDMDGPGGTEFVGSSSLLVYHAWPEGRVGSSQEAGRGLRLARIDVDQDGWVTVDVTHPSGRDPSAT